MAKRGAEEAKGGGNSAVPAVVEGLQRNLAEVSKYSVRF